MSVDTITLEEQVRVSMPHDINKEVVWPRTKVYWKFDPEAVFYPMCYMFPEGSSFSALPEGGGASEPMCEMCIDQEEARAYYTGKKRVRG